MKTTTKATRGDERVLSVRQAVAYMDEHYNGVSRRHHRSVRQTDRGADPRRASRPLLVSWPGCEP